MRMRPRNALTACFILCIIVLSSTAQLAGPSYSMIDAQQRISFVTEVDPLRIYHGGTIESIRIVEYATIEQALAALNAGSADLFGHRLNSSYHSVLESYPNVKEQWAYDNFAFLLTFNSLFYPLNEAHLRTAVAYAINKTAVAQDVFNGTVDEIDFVLPLFNEYSVEEEEGGRYYDSHISEAQTELAKAGMLDVDEDGIVEAPNGAEVVFPIWYPSDVPGMNESITLISSNLIQAGINNTVVPLTFDTLQYEISHHNTSYAIAIYQQELDQYGFEWLTTTFHADNKAVVGENIANLDDATLNDLAEKYKDAIYRTSAEIYGQQAMMYIFEACPVIPLFTTRWLSVYTDANFENWPNDTYAGAFSVWTPALVTSKEASSELIVAVLPEFFDGFFRSLNPFYAGTVIGPEWVERYRFNPYLLVYDSPLATTPDGRAVQRHATSWEMEFLGVVPDLTINESRATYHTDPYANWTDGSPMGAQDYRFTFEYYKNNSLTAYSYLDEVKVTGLYQAGVEYSIRDMFLDRKLGALPILPEHIWKGKNATSYDPSPGQVVGSGPFMFSEFTKGSEVSLVVNPDYYPVIDEDPPVLLSLTISPNDPVPSESVVFKVFVSDRSMIDNVTLKYVQRVGTINFTGSTPMVLDASGYQGTVPARVTAKSVYWEIHASDVWGNSAMLANGTYPTFEEEPEPTLDLIPILVASSGVVLVIILGVSIRRRRKTG